MRSSELVERYAARSDLDLSGLDYYVTFGFWKLTCIIAGVYARYAGGAMGDVPASQVDGFKVVLDQLAQATLDSVSPGTGGGPP
jgi:aminoglycoside phosphotransferase (APT) family kinase protein